MPRALFLQPHVYLCRGKRHWVILDVNRDKYLCVDRRQFELLGPSLKGWAEPAGVGCDAAAVSDAGLALANDLLKLEILSERSDIAKDARPTAHSLPTEALDPDLPARLPWASCAHAGSFLMSSARASRELRDQRFQSIVELVRERKNGRPDHAGPFDTERARSLVSVFNSLRLFYPRSYLCLFDSLALIHFLARFHVYPDWVFGVNADPFEAHCWVQADGVVLNDTVQRVSGFTPIMRI
jgi:Transglutaminase-like superfamily